MASTLTIDESKTFLAFCRSGRLYDVDQWIAAGKSIVTHPSIKRTPLLTAIDTGFHSWLNCWPETSLGRRGRTEPCGRPSKVDVST